MTARNFIPYIFAAAALLACGNSNDKKVESNSILSSFTGPDSLKYEKESRIRNIRQLTFGGDNAEAYWSSDGQKLVMQVSNPAWEVECDQIYLYDLSRTIEAEEILPLISTGKGRTTCSYFMPGDEHIVYASTHVADENCPAVPERGPSGEYVWPIYSSFDIFVADLEGNMSSQLTDVPGYDAEPTVSPKGDKIVFTSTRNGDLDLYTMDIDGSNVHQVTDELGYDGGAFFSPDGSKLLFRASRPTAKEDVELYKSLLAKDLVQPTNMELYVCDVDGSNIKKITDLGNANWAPFFHPSGEKIIFSSNHNSRRGFPFNLFLINPDGSGLEQVTYDEAFDSFPMFSPDGKHLVFSSNRNNGGSRDTNVFIAEWVD